MYTDKGQKKSSDNYCQIDTRNTDKSNQNIIPGGGGGRGNHYDVNKPVRCVLMNI